MGKIPNILSTFRLLLAGFFPFAAEQEWFWLILAGGGSDFLDGWIARRWKVQSWQGGLLDAAADKLFVLSVLVTFVLAGRFSPWWIPLVIARGLTVIAIALYAFCRREWAAFRNMEARLSGKLATGGQFLLLLGTALAPASVLYLLPMAIFFSLLASIDYGRKFILALRLQDLDMENAPRGTDPPW